MSLVFKCDVCGSMEDVQRSTSLLREGKTDICIECATHLDYCADLLQQPGFKEQLVELHKKFYGTN